MRFSLHVDAGYLYAALATKVTGSSNRAAITVDEPQLIDGLVRLAAADCGGQLLRVLWYDAGHNGLPNKHQESIGLIDGVKLRMGRISIAGEQKGVDLRLGLDLMSMGTNSAVETAYVLSGDDDLTEAVTDAQDLGLQIKLIAAPGVAQRPQSVAGHLHLAVDALLLIPQELIDAVVTPILRTPAAPSSAAPSSAAPPQAGPTGVPGRAPDGAATATTGADAPRPAVIPPPTARPQGNGRPVPAPQDASGSPAPAPARGGASAAATTSLGEYLTGDVIDPEVIDRVARATFGVWDQSATTEQRHDLMQARPVIPSELDRVLLRDLVDATSVWDIPNWARYQLRQTFWTAVDEREATQAE